MAQGLSIKKLLIANRGEIACRVIRAANELGLETVQVVSEADTDSLAARLADDVKVIGPPHPAKSYLDAGAILSAASECDADAIHPGYGFLSENARFADAVESAGRTFIGPLADTIRLMGDKAAARAQARDAGVPIVPGSDGVINDVDEALTLAEAIGFPVMIKASAGGGGRGIRVAESSEEVRRLAPQASSEAEAAFGDNGIYIEKLIESARHIEVQVLGDGFDVVHFFDRECSLQRRRQKVWEEAPSAAVSDAVRARLCASAVDLAKSVNYRGAGTVEYLYDEATGEFYFIEMNTRLQVEHPVTEAITGIDIVREQIRIAAGMPLGFGQEDIAFSGHAIECRINAESSETFAPSPGRVTDYHPPGGLGVRVDSGLYAGYSVPPNYDSLIAKLIVHGANRNECLMRLRRALQECVIGGIETTLTLHDRIISHADFINGAYDIKWLEAFVAEAD